MVPTVEMDELIIYESTSEVEGAVDFVALGVPSLPGSSCLMHRVVIGVSDLDSRSGPVVSSTNIFAIVSKARLLIIDSILLWTACGSLRTLIRPRIR